MALLRVPVSVWSIALLTLVSQGCTSLDNLEKLQKAIGPTCQLDSDCVGDTVCLFGRCREECNTSADCEFELRCVEGDESVRACLLPDETKCAAPADCPYPLVCGVDGECRNACSVDADCVAPQVCSYGSCADPAELDEGSSELPVPDDFTGEGQPCLYSSECPGDYVCVNQYCGPECKGPKDCDPGATCSVDGRCVVVVPPECVLSTDCALGEVCSPTGNCEPPPPPPVECASTADCPSGDVCSPLGTCEACVTAAECSHLDEDCNAGACVNGACQKLPSNEGSVCQSAGPCGTTNICSAGACACGGLTITPSDSMVKITLPVAGQTVAFTCSDAITGAPAQNVTFSVSSPELGTIAQDGVFTPVGAGQVEVSCTDGVSTATTTLNVTFATVENAAKATQQQIDVLKGPPGSFDPSWKWVYPYPNTVFPRGILSPEVHLDEGAQPGSLFYLRVVAPNFEYEGFFAGNGPQTRLQMPQAAWDALGAAAAGGSAQVQVAKLVNGQKVGPLSRNITIAAGAMKGSVYYSTYDSPTAAGGALMRVKGLSTGPDVLLAQCTVCHSAGADGSTLAATDHGANSGLFDLADGQLNPPLVWSAPQSNTPTEKAAFPAIFPKNGEVIVVCGAPGPSYPPNIPGMQGPWTSELRLKNGTVVPNSGIEAYYAQSPMFSHDGKKLAFYDRPAGGGPGVLAMLDYDHATQKFSNYQLLATPGANRHLSWPAFTPDDRYVVYQDGTGEDLATWSGNTGRLFAVDLVTKQKFPLASLNGTGYLPQGARDENKNYEPSFLPIATGGYFWLTYTSRRTYGNRLLGSEGETKRIWVSAFDIGAPSGIDPSHPSFYLAGQELQSNNGRSVWTLDACHADGQACGSGDECCGGFCNPSADPAVKVCGPSDGACSDEFEPCALAADCCDAAMLCINARCALAPPT
jgi:hypothetical protein